LPALTTHCRCLLFVLTAESPVRCAEGDTSMFLLFLASPLSVAPWMLASVIFAQSHQSYRHL
jgi:hypothetical protein